MASQISVSEIRAHSDKIIASVRNSTIVLGSGVLLLQVSLIAVIIIVWTGTERLNENNKARAEVTRGQIACFNQIQGNYIARLGALAETGNRQMLGEPPNAEDTRKAVIGLQEGDMLLRRVAELCYTETPDKTPLDGDPTR